MRKRCVRSDSDSCADGEEDEVSENENESKEEIIFAKSDVTPPRGGREDYMKQSKNISCLSENVAELESLFITFKAQVESEILNMHRSVQAMSNLEDKVVRLDSNIKANNVKIDDRLYNIEVQNDKSIKDLQNLMNQVKKITEQKNQLLKEQK